METSGESLRPLWQALPRVRQGEAPQVLLHALPCAIVAAEADRSLDSPLYPEEPMPEAPDLYAIAMRLMRVLQTLSTADQERVMRSMAALMGAEWIPAEEP